MYEWLNYLPLKLFKKCIDMACRGFDPLWNTYIHTYTYIYYWFYLNKILLYYSLFTTGLTKYPEDSGLQSQIMQIYMNPGNGQWELPHGLRAA